MSTLNHPLFYPSADLSGLEELSLALSVPAKRVLENYDDAPNLAGGYAAGDNKVWSINGANAADADGTLDTTGAIQLNSSANGAADDEVVLLTNTNKQNFTPTVGDEPVLFAQIKTDADDATEVQYGIGIASDDDGDDVFDGGDGELDPNNATAADTYLGFTFDTDDSDTNWQIDIIDDGGTITSIDTGVSFAADTRYAFIVKVDSNNRPYFWIQKEGDGPKVFGPQTLEDEYDVTSLTATNVVGAFAGVSNLSTADRDLFVERFAFGANFG
jgi:hypothetical protein